MVSIIVPIYKTEKLLSKCINSIISQTYQNFELILVDDGSPDNCPQICDDYASLDKRIIVIHQNNSGNNSARLNGLKKASGEYVMFVDSDDTLVGNAIETLLHHIEKGYDVVRGRNYRVLKHSYTKTIENRKIVNNIIEGSEAYIKAILCEDLAPYLWGAIYKRTLFTEEMFHKTITFPRSEDWMIHIMIGKKISKALCIENIVYNYLINDNSIMQTRIFSYDYVKRMQDTILQELEGSSREIINIFIANRLSEYIRCFFLPELPFIKSSYLEIKKQMKDNQIRTYVTSMIDSKFLYFFNFLPLYYIYTRFYCFLFLKKKLNGHKRAVLY
ncbi:glycosyltransferase family 2 protein [Phocaeicola plebeius]|uniref:glycosyltransferase family 2 protein n=1 Tax=Phocaeicola plebeius TaxID=310297 RepID=UPI003AF1C48C